MRALISIHDVFPDTLGRVECLVDDLRARDCGGLTLLVTPGLDWKGPQIERLAAWQRDGIELAAHGWHHRTRSIRGAWHRLHSLTLSRQAAEHLALDEAGIAALMQRAHDWFGEHDLDAPTSYVPPAWALGPIGHDALRSLPYRRVEVTRGLIDTSTGRLRRLPLAGFEADTPVRAGFLRCWNRTQTRRARRWNRSLRIGIHPCDPELRLRDDLRALLSADWQSRRYDET